MAGEAGKRLSRHRDFSPQTRILRYDSAFHDTTSLGYRHDSETFRYLAENPTDEILLDNLRALLLCKGSLQPAAEMGDMIKEIKKEVWYRNEKEHEAAEEVAEEWRAKYLVKWREARMFEAFILIEKRAAELLKILRA